MVYVHRGVTHVRAGQVKSGQSDGSGAEVGFRGKIEWEGGGKGKRKDDGVPLDAGVVVCPLVTACLALFACLLTFGSPPMAEVLSRASRRRRAILSCRA